MHRRYPPLPAIPRSAVSCFPRGVHAPPNCGAELQCRDVDTNLLSGALPEAWAQDDSFGSLNYL